MCEMARDAHFRFSGVAVACVTNAGIVSNIISLLLSSVLSRVAKIPVIYRLLFQSAGSKSDFVTLFLSLLP